MIIVSRQLLLEFRAVWRRACGTARSAAQKLNVQFTTDQCGLRIRWVANPIAVELHQPGSYPAEMVNVPGELLLAAAGRTPDEVTLEQRAPHQIQATWTECGIPQLRSYDVAETAEGEAGFPELPASFFENSPELLSALRDASRIAAPDASRFALNQLQLAGSTGQILASDGRQLLAQSGFQFPWSDRPLVPASKVFSSRELAAAGSVAVGATADWMAVRSGPWTVWLKLDRASRFPRVEDVIPQPNTAVARLEIAPADARFLARTIHHLPADEAHNRPITLDLNGRVLLRAQAVDDSRPTELVLSRSRLIGQPMAISTDRQFLARALELGFREVRLFGRQAPALCDDGQRQYLWAVLDGDALVPASENAHRIESSLAEADRPVSRSRKHGRQFQAVG